MVVRSRLEFEGIECFVKDELTVQVNNFYSQAIGGIELQVKSEDVENALVVLTEMGHVQTNRKRVRKSPLLTVTDYIPVLNKWPLSLRLLVLIPLFLAPLIYFIQVKTQPSLNSLLAQTCWCVNTIEHNGNSQSFNYLPEPAIYSQYQSCEVQLSIDSDYHIYLPNGTDQIKGHVMLRNDSLEIYGLDTLQNKYHHVYKVDVNGHRLTLTSSTTKIWCTKTLGFLWL
ncbi:MAG: hypothetical protein ACI9JN_000420 [Bacteroidia bacterium]|jgi:hypothetical protein